MDPAAFFEAAWPRRRLDLDDRQASRQSGSIRLIEVVPAQQVHASIGLATISEDKRRLLTISLVQADLTPHKSARDLNTGYVIPRKNKR